MNDYHNPALLKEVIKFLNVEKDSWYVDATLGGGGHTEEILKCGGKVLGIDVDEDSIEFVKAHLKKYVSEKRLFLCNRNFLDIEEVVKKFCPKDPLGILFDLGVSTHQLKTEERGFSFNSESDLDMRMGKNLAVKAKDLINGLSKRELEFIFLKYGEESYAKKIAQTIVSKRKVSEIKTGKELAEIVEGVKGKENFGEHAATKVFQALRIVINEELDNFEKALPRAFRVLAPKGRILVISFHSLEDRIAKDFGKRTHGLRILTKVPITASSTELSQNRQVRSAKMRVFEKV